MAAAANVGTGGLTGAGPFTVNSVPLFSSPPNNNINTNTNNINTNQIDTEVSSLYESSSSTANAGSQTSGNSGPPSGTDTSSNPSGPSQPSGSSGSVSLSSDTILAYTAINPTAGSPESGQGGNPGTLTLIGAAPSTDAPQTVGGIDTGGTLFIQISPASGANLNGNFGSGGSSGSSSDSSGSSSELTLVFVSQPPPVYSVSHGEPQHPLFTQPFVPGYVNQIQFPNMPKSGVPGIDYNFSSSGNSSLW
jgi:hypothetical protein